jgi:hypothetical protein
MTDQIAEKIYSDTSTYMLGTYESSRGNVLDVITRNGQIWLQTPDGNKRVVPYNDSFIQKLVCDIRFLSCYSEEERELFEKIMESIAQAP